jgi:hypothetical protein
MKHFPLLITILAILFASFTPKQVNAQQRINCGESVQGVASSSQILHEYQISMPANTKIIVHTEVDAGDLEIISNIIGPNNQNYGQTDLFYRADWVTIYGPYSFRAGNYIIQIQGMSDAGGSYTLYLSCVNSDGTVTNANRITQGIACGSIIENEFLYDLETHDYYIDLQRGDIMTVFAESNGSNLKPSLEIGTLDTETNEFMDRIDMFYADLSVSSENSIPADGLYTVAIRSKGEGGGSYLMTIRCILADGTIIEPGDIEPSPILLEPTLESTSYFIAYGFPNIPGIDFSTGIEIPLTLGQPQTAPIGADGSTVALYTYEASAGANANLSMTRLSGNLSIGVAVINKADNSILFLGGLPTSNNLTVELTFPNDGTYAIGLFRLDVANATGASGAVQVTLQ